MAGAGGRHLPSAVVGENFLLTEAHQVFREFGQGGAQIGVVKLVAGGLRQPSRRGQEKNRQRHQRRALADADGDAAAAIERLEKEQFFRTVQEPTRQTEDKINQKKNRDERRTLEHERRDLPIAGDIRGDRLIVGDGNHETHHQTRHGERFSE